jgi:hypothetical protein
VRYSAPFERPDETKTARTRRKYLAGKYRPIACARYPRVIPLVVNMVERLKRPVRDIMGKIKSPGAREPSIFRNRRNPVLNGGEGWGGAAGGREGDKRELYFPAASRFANFARPVKRDYNAPRRGQNAAISAGLKAALSRSAEINSRRRFDIISANGLRLVARWSRFNSPARACRMRQERRLAAGERKVRDESLRRAWRERRRRLPFLARTSAFLEKYFLSLRLVTHRGSLAVE